MERKHVIGVGVGIGLGFAAVAVAASPLLLRRMDSISLQNELLELVQSGKDGSVTVQDLPYYLNEQARAVLTNAAYMHLKRAQFSKFASRLSPASQAILLSGLEGTEAYHQRIAKALAHNFDAKLLLLDVTDLVSKSKCGTLTRKQLTAQHPTRSVTRGIASNLVGFFGPWSRSRVQLASVSPVGGRSRNSSHGNLADMDSAASAERQHKSDGSVGPLEAAGTCRPAISGTRRVNSSFEEDILVDALFKVLASFADVSPVVVYLRDVDYFFKGPRMYSLFLSKMKKLRGPVLILGSRIRSGDEKLDSQESTEKLEVLFRYKVNVQPPTEDLPRLVSWKSQVEEDMKAIQAQDNRNHILEVLIANNMECDDITSVGFSDSLLLGSCIEEIVVSALSYHLMNTENPEFRGGKLIISANSLTHGLSLFQAGQLDSVNKLQSESKPEPHKEPQETTLSAKNEAKVELPVPELKADVKVETSKAETPKKVEAEGTKPPPPPPKPKPADAVLDNEFEKRIRPEVIPAGEIGVNFQDIGALDNVKEALQELVMLPLRRPELFSRGGLLKRCKGILLFGPPGTGKTMLAKAVATEAGASFINVSMSAITSKWFGEDEKNVRALFTLAAKVAPTVIFIDEVDSMLGQRSRVGEHEAMRKIKNEFMAHWDGLLTRGGERVLVLAATNRPFDLDEAIIRRFERRIMVGLPDSENREKILRAILSKEDLAEGFDFKELSAMTEGYSGSDLKNLCVAAAYQPVRELLQKERKEVDKKKAGEKGKDVAVTNEKTDCEIAELKDETSNPDCTVLSFRSLTLEDMRLAKKHVSASFSSEGSGMQELQEWNELYGEGGSRKKQQLTYFM